MISLPIRRKDADINPEPCTMSALPFRRKDADIDTEPCTMGALAIRSKDADINPEPCTMNALPLRSREMVVDPMIPGEEHTSPKRTSQTAQVYPYEDRTHDPLASDPVAIRAPRESRWAPKPPRVPPKFQQYCQSYSTRPEWIGRPIPDLFSEPSWDLKTVTPSNYVSRTASRNKSSRALSSRNPYPPVMQLRSAPQNRETTPSANQSTLTCFYYDGNVNKLHSFLSFKREDEDAEVEACCKCGEKVPC